MKKIFIILMCIVAIICGLFFGFKLVEKKYNYEISKINEYNYFVFMENELFGVINKDGNTIVNATYKNIVIPNLIRMI